jgi:hypothetical protein
MEWDLYVKDTGNFCPPPGPGPAPGYTGSYNAYINNSSAPVPGGTPDLLVDTFTFACQPQFPAGGQPTHTFSSGGTDTSGPFRLGVNIEPIDVSFHAPEFWTNYRIVYRWWADESTTRSSTFCGTTINYYAAPNPSPIWDYLGPHPGMTPRSVGYVGTIHFGEAVVGGDGVGDVSVVSFSSINVDGWSVDTSEFPVTWNLSRDGGGSTHNTGPGSTTADASSPYRFAYDIDITKFGDGTTGAHVVDNFEVPIQLHSDHTQKMPQSASLACPISNSYIVPVTSWETHQKEMIFLDGTVRPIRFDIDRGWALDQNPPLDTRDLQVPLWPNPARISPDSGGATYTGVDAELQSSLSIEFPSGPGEPRSSHWVINDGAYGSVTEGSSSTLFHVTDARAVFTRTLLSHWRTWTTSPFPRGIDAYEITKHNYFSDADDIWGWESYGWLQVPHTGTVGGPANLKVDGVWLEVFDPHTTGADRATDYAQTEHPFSFGYDLPVSSGSSSPFIDLLFPISGGTNPLYPSRVDKLTLYNLPVGDTTVSDIKLVTRHDGYLKVDYGPPVQRLDYSCLHASQDGSFPWGNWGDERLKPDEIGNHPPYGGALRYVDPLTGSGTDTILDAQYLLVDLIAHWNRMEGWIISHDGASFDTANRDSFGNAIGPEFACWLRPIAPHMMYAPGGSFHPPCGPIVREVIITNAFDFAIYTRWPIWGAREELVGIGGARAPVGTHMKAIRDDTGATVVTADTDASGYVTLSPLPANGVLSYHVEFV